MLENFFSLFQSEIFIRIVDAALASAPVWVPLLLVIICFELWLDYKRREWINGKGNVLLEIKVPREMSKSPVAMELFLNTLYQTGVGTLQDVYAKGRVRTWFSLEIVSIEGSVHFFIWCLGDFKHRVETQLYAQFPNIEVHEVPDYSLGIQHDPDNINFGWFGQFALTKKDAYPIKSYVDYGLDRDPKEEYKNDPLISVLEYLGALKKGEQSWIQILIQAHAKEGIKLGRVFVKPDWKKGIEDEINDIRKKAKPAGEEEGFLTMTKGQQELVASIERNAGKNAFDTMIRATYFAEKDSYNPGNIGGLIGSLTQFNSSALNGFKPGFKAGYDYAWQDLSGKKKVDNERKLLEAYKRRSFFNTPFRNFHGKPFVLTTEELATLFHFPSSEVAATPTLSRLPSKKSEAPPNLPI